MALELSTYLKYPQGLLCQRLPLGLSFFGLASISNYHHVDDFLIYVSPALPSHVIF